MLVYMEKYFCSILCSINQTILGLKYVGGNEIMRTIGKGFWKATENTIKFQSDPIGKVVNLSKKTFSKETFQILNKNLNFILTPKVYNLHRLDKEMGTFYRTIQQNRYCKDLNEIAVPTEEQILKPTNHEKWTPNKIHQNGTSKTATI